MTRLILAICLSCLLCAQAAADCSEPSLVLRSRALGGAFSSRADDPSAIFVNPAGLVSDELYAAYVDYCERATGSAGRESRVAVVAGAGRTRFGLGWYRLGGARNAVDHLLLAGVARRVIEGTPGSYLSIGANASVGGSSPGSTCCGGGRTSWSKVTGDLGLVVQPLPVVSLSYAVGNVSDERLDAGGGLDRWSRVQRWGISYFWEERIVVSFEERFCSGETTLHYGFSVKSSLPIELMAGFSDGNVSGGIRWLGGSFGAAVAFSSDGERGVTWIGSCEIAYRGKNGKGN